MMTVVCVSRVVESILLNDSSPFTICEGEEENNAPAQQHSRPRAESSAMEVPELKIEPDHPGDWANCVWPGVWTGYITWMDHIRWIYWWSMRGWRGDQPLQQRLMEKHWSTSEVSMSCLFPCARSLLRHPAVLLMSVFPPFLPLPPLLPVPCRPREQFKKILPVYINQGGQF